MKGCDKLKLGDQQTEAKLRVLYFAITGTFHGSIIEAPSEGAARRAFHKFYNGESIVMMKIINRIP